MRHFIIVACPAQNLVGPISPGSRRMGQASAMAVLIPSPRRTLARATGRMGAFRTAIALASITTATHQNLTTAAVAQKEAARGHPR